RRGGVGAGRRGPRRRGRHRDLRGHAGVPAARRPPHRARAPAPRRTRAAGAAAAGSDRVPGSGRHRPGAARRRAPRPRRRARLPRRTHAAATPLVAARTARASRRPPRPPRGAPARGRAVSDDLAALFLRHVCQTSPAPLGIEVARAAGSTVWDAGGRAYLDLLAGMGVANVGHTHPEVVAAGPAQGERPPPVMAYVASVPAAPRSLRNLP